MKEDPIAQSFCACFPFPESSKVPNRSAPKAAPAPVSRCGLVPPRGRAAGGRSRTAAVRPAAAALPSRCRRGERGRSTGQRRFAASLGGRGRTHGGVLRVLQRTRGAALLILQQMTRTTRESRCFFHLCLIGSTVSRFFTLFVTKPAPVWPRGLPPGRCTASLPRHLSKPRVR